MKKCDSCGKIIADERDIMCPHCGAVSTKSTVCTHNEAEDRWSRSGESYSFHGDESTTYSTAPGEAEINSNKPFSFGSTEARQPRQPRQPMIRMKPKTSKSNQKKIPAFVVIFAVALFANFVIGFLSSGDFDDTWGYEEISDSCVSASSAVFVPTSVEDGVFFAELHLNGVTGDTEINGEELFFDVCAGEKSQIDEDGYFEVEAYTSFEAMSVDDLDYEITDALNIDTFYEIESCYFEQYGTLVTLELPFDAFSVDKNGTVFYYDVEYDGDTMRITAADITSVGAF